ncbi:MAG TPA: aminoglycoside phosphotransferase family protein [Pyrinomonadaceae bacterium]|nr:aminoglycoside phosphotransferase family protein [Pyrinomonadaceae bacterium]
MLSVKKPFPNLSYNFVALCVCENGSEAVLKIALPLNNREIFNEASFLQLSDSKAAVKLLNSDINRRSILLERLMTGKHLKEVFCQEEAKTVEIAIGIMRRILKKPPRNPAFPRLEDWFNNFFIKSPKTNFPFEFLRKTRGFFEELSLAPKFLIHGDLHHENILLAQREPFLIIDPKSVFGNISYEIAVFLNNHFWWLNGQSNLKGKLDVVIERFSEAFEIKLEDLRKWAFCQMVLSAWWTFEDNGENWQPELAFAEFWGKL